MAARMNGSELKGIRERVLRWTKLALADELGVSRSPSGAGSSIRRPFLSGQRRGSGNWRRRLLPGQGQSRRDAPRRLEGHVGESLYAWRPKDA